MSRTGSLVSSVRKVVKTAQHFCQQSATHRFCLVCWYIVGKGWLSSVFSCVRWYHVKTDFNSVSRDQRTDRQFELSSSQVQPVYFNCYTGTHTTIYDVHVQLRHTQDCPRRAAELIDTCTDLQHSVIIRNTWRHSNYYLPQVKNVNYVLCQTYSAQIYCIEITLKLFAVCIIQLFIAPLECETAVGVGQVLAVTPTDTHE